MSAPRLCPCGCGAPPPVEARCAACGRLDVPDILGPDGRCVWCWEADLAPSERGAEPSRLMSRALDAMRARFGEWRAGVTYAAWPWARRVFAAHAREVSGEFSVAVEAPGPRVLLRRLARWARQKIDGVKTPQFQAISSQSTPASKAT